MAAEKNKSEQKGAQGKSADSAESTSDELNAQAFLRTVNDALQQYSQALRDIHNNGVKRSEELYQEYIKSQREQQTVFDENVKEDYRNYVAGTQQAWGQEQVHAKMDDATRTYLTALNERQMELSKNLDNLQRNYVDTVQKLINQVQQDYINAYQDYLRSFQQAWQRADVSNLDTHTLASVGQLLIAASNFAGQTLQMR